MSKQVLPQITHILFDLDGLLIDTESCYVNAYNNVTKEWGKEFTWQVKTKCVGTAQWSKQATNTLIQLLDLPLTADQLDQRAYQQFLNVIRDVELMAGAERLVKHLYDHNIPMAIATGSDRKHFDLKIAKHAHFFSKYFQFHLLASEDPNIKSGKPSPDIFIEGMKKFGTQVRSENVLVFEDSSLGIEAAIAAGMPCVWVPDYRMHELHNGLSPTQTLNSLNQFEPQLYGLPAF